MKNLVFLLLLIAAVSFNACSLSGEDPLDELTTGQDGGGSGGEDHPGTPE